MREILGRLGDGFYWGGCLGVIWAVGYIPYDLITRDAISKGRWIDYHDILLIAAFISIKILAFLDRWNIIHFSV